MSDYYDTPGIIWNEPPPLLPPVRVQLPGLPASVKFSVGHGIGLAAVLVACGVPAGYLIVSVIAGDSMALLVLLAVVAFAAVGTVTVYRAAHREAVKRRAADWLAKYDEQISDLGEGAFGGPFRLLDLSAGESGFQAMIAGGDRCYCITFAGFVASGAAGEVRFPNPGYDPPCLELQEPGQLVPVWVNSGPDITIGVDPLDPASWPRLDYRRPLAPRPSSFPNSGA